jgi:hypothetical protein
MVCKTFGPWTYGIYALAKAQISHCFRSLNSTAILHFAKNALFTVPFSGSFFSGMYIVHRFKGIFLRFTRTIVNALDATTNDFAAHLY